MCDQGEDAAFFFFVKSRVNTQRKSSWWEGEAIFANLLLLFSAPESRMESCLYSSLLFLKLRSLLVAARLLKPIKLLVCSLVSVPLTSPGGGEGGGHTMLCLGYPGTHDVTRGLGPR